MSVSFPPSLAAIPARWYQNPPKILLVGEGAFTSTLAIILRAETLGRVAIKTAPLGNPDRGYPQVLGELSHILLVVGEEMSARETLQLHNVTWQWVEKLAPEGDQHELAFLFILPPNASSSFEMALAAGLSSPRVEPATGHAVWRMSGSLSELTNLLASIQPTDMLPLRARQTADNRRAVLAELQRAVRVEDVSTVRGAAQAALKAFSGQEHLLDVFCREPSHQHGNRLRSWLHTVVTEGATQERLTEETKQLGNWLSVEIAG